MKDDQRQALEALRLSALNRVTRAALEAEWVSYLRHWYGDGVQQATYPCLQCLVDGRIHHRDHELVGVRGGEGIHADAVPVDHASLWHVAFEPLVFVSQPYGVDHKDLRALLTFADAHDLELEIDERASFHCVGATVPILLWHRGTRLKYFHSVHAEGTSA